ncbi:hypothetical protein HJG60_010844 [Phyllostomus discolor]|uniref:Uncharacterized protein n=1 Tax=Phyllostomus discolor TaxID=89673 RepID=A0A834AH31_9CHIR|nr:hypothetical protein HJG60_010844 [Phyllostomus discolor]
MLCVNMCTYSDSSSEATFGQYWYQFCSTFQFMGIKLYNLVFPFHYYSKRIFNRACFENFNLTPNSCNYNVTLNDTERPDSIANTYLPYFIKAFLKIGLQIVLFSRWLSLYLMVPVSFINAL